MRANTGDRLKPEVRLDAALKKLGLLEGAPTASYQGLYYVRNPKMPVTAPPGARKRHGAGRKGGKTVSYARPDFLFLWPGGGLVVLVHGCFWHCCPKHFKPVGRGKHKGWKKKFETNRERDGRIRSCFYRQGYHTLVVWEHDLKTDELVGFAAADVHDRVERARRLDRNLK